MFIVQVFESNIPYWCYVIQTKKKPNGKRQHLCEPADGHTVQMKMRWHKKYHVGA